MSATDRDQALALAGVAQFALWAHELAADGTDRRERLDLAIRAIYNTDPSDASEVFGGSEGVRDGIDFLKRQLRSGTRSTPSDALVARYIGQILRLATRLRRSDTAMSGIRGGIDKARLADPEQAPDVLDETYREHVSHFRPRLMIRGHGSYLQNPVFAKRIRTLLLAAIRAAVLWRQCGGGFIRLLLFRKRLVQALDKLEDAAQA